MRLIDEVRLFREQGGKPRGARTVIQDDVLVAEFDARLHDDGDDAGQRSLESVAAENLAVDLQSVARLFEARGLDLRNGVMRASRRGNLGADHINRHGASERGGRAFGPGSQSCRALRNRRVAQRLRFTPAAHRRVEMELPKAGPRVGIHHVFCLAHRRLGRLVAPWVWAEMVAAEDEATGGQVFPARNVHRPAHEIGWLHARVAANWLTWLQVASISRGAPASVASRAAALTTSGWAEQTDGIPFAVPSLREAASVVRASITKERSAWWR